MKVTSKSLLIGGLLSAPALSMAQAQLTYGRPLVEGLTTVQYLIQLLNIILPSAAVILFFFLVAKFIWSKIFGGDTKPTTLLWGLVALAILFGVYGLVRLLGSFVGVNTDGSARITAPALPQQAR
jgi:hypothetical protein